MKMATQSLLNSVAIDYLYWNQPNKDMSKLTDLTGKVYGRLTVISHSHSIKSGGRIKHYWNCDCSCGTKLKVRSDGLKKTQSCGCFQQDVARAYMTTHGNCAESKKSKEYSAWVSMKERCYNKKIKEYFRYGGRGITVCDRWMESFENFLSDMGPAPTPKHSLDRKENNKGYFPGNCRWATVLEQVYNRRNTIMCTYKGDTKPLKTFCKELKLSYSMVRLRIQNYDYSIVEAFEKPRRHNGNKPNQT